MSNVEVAWFEVPVADKARATEFYGTVLGTPLGAIPGPDGADMAVFMGAEGPVGALNEGETPASGGVVVYFECDDIAAALQRAEKAGGKILQERTAIGPYGFIGQLSDSEGNTVALHTNAE